MNSNGTPDVKYGLFFIGSFLLQKCIVYTGEDEEIMADSAVDVYKANEDNGSLLTFSRAGRDWLEDRRKKISSVSLRSSWLGSFRI